MQCGFEQGLLGECSELRIHDAYQKSYDDISWTEAAWEVRYPGSAEKYNTVNELIQS